MENGSGFSFPNYCAELSDTCMAWWPPVGNMSDLTAGSNHFMGCPPVPSSFGGSYDCTAVENVTALIGSNNFMGCPPVPSSFGGSYDCTAVENVTALIGSNNFMGCPPVPSSFGGSYDCTAVENVPALIGSNNFMGSPPVQNMPSCIGDSYDCTAVENVTALTGSNNFMVTDFTDSDVFTVENGLSGLLDNHTEGPWMTGSDILRPEWFQAENTSGLSGLDKCTTGFTRPDTFMTANAGVPPYTYNYVWNSDGTSVNIDEIEKGAARICLAPDLGNLQQLSIGRSPYEGVSQEVMLTADLQDQRSSSIISTPTSTQDSTSLWVIKVEYNTQIFRLNLSLPTMDVLKTQVLKRDKKLEADALKFMYKDEDGEMITIACDEDLHFCFEHFKSYGQKARVRLSLLADASF